jgi:hypothetical protein
MQNETRILSSEGRTATPSLSIKSGFAGATGNSLAGWFLNRDFTDSGIRSMWVQVKLIF